MHPSVAVVTGASSGIGRATALELARRGTSVVAVARREEALKDVASACRRLGVPAFDAPADVTDEEAVRGVARAAVERFGRVDLWVNNAGVTLFARFEEAPSDLYRRVIETNLFGSVHGARAAIPVFREQGGGMLVNVASVFGAIGAPYLSAYVLSKWAIRALGECLRQELVDAPNIHVCTVLPASTDTPLFQQAANYTGWSIVPLRPIYSPERVARVVVRLPERPRREVTIGLAGRGSLLGRTLAPGLTERLTGRLVARFHFEDQPAERTDGNLHEPIAELALLDGGWRQSNRRRFTLAGAAAAAPVLVAWTWLRD
jgi:NAD(P)-dependent dehydrogenase (short-subunit alcohol dehydrogenase family)